MLISSILTVKFISLFTKDMIINLNTSKKIASNLLALGRSYLLDKQHLRSSDVVRASGEKQVQSTEYLVHNWLESLFARAQMVVLWHDKTSSFFSLAVFLVSFRLFTQYAPRFYATVITIILIYNLTKVWFKHIWPEIRVPPEGEEESRLDIDRWTHLHPQLMTFSELVDWLKNLSNSIKFHLTTMASMRREKPGLFCLKICLFLSCTAYIGNRVQDSDLLFYLTTILVLLPGLYLHVIPKSLRDKLRTIYSMGSPLSPSSVAQILTSSAHGTTPTSPDHHLPSMTSEDHDSGSTEGRSQISSSSDTQKSDTYIEQTLSSQKQVSLFEQLKGRVTIPFMAASSGSTKCEQVEESEDLIEKSTTTDCGGLKQAEALPLIDKTSNFDEPTQQTNPLTCCTNQSSNTDLSSNDSSSLVDIDEEQQDGFVLL